MFGLAGTYTFAPLIGWARAAWSTAVVALFAASWILVVDPLIGLRLDIALVGVLSTAMLVGSIVMWRRSAREPYRLPVLRVLPVLAVLAPAAVVAAAFYGASVVRGMSLAWAMNGDAQFNTVLSRHIADGNGETAENVQVLSLAQGLMAIVHLPGRDGVPKVALLTHDITSQANLWILLILLSSVLAGMIAEQVLRQAPSLLRYFGIVASALLPLSWHMTGYAIESGFYNVSLTFLVLELAFYFWLATRRSPLCGSVVLLVLTVVMLGAWTPMAIIPLTMALLSGWVGFRQGPSRVLLGVWVASALQLLIFVSLYIAPAFFSKSSSLSASGTILPINFNLYVAVTVLALVVTLFLGVWKRSAWSSETIMNSQHTQFGLGMALMALSAATGTAFLLFQNRNLGEPWIYYPIKFAWLSMEMLVLLIFLGGCLLIAWMPRRRLIALAAALTIFLFSLLQLNPPQDRSGTAVFPLLAIAKNGSAMDVTLPLLTSVSGEKVFFSRYLGNDEDTFMNQWQFQITAKDEFTPIRGYAYRVVTSLKEICDAAGTWGGGVQVITAQRGWADSLNARCGSSLTAVVREPVG